jgi:hypothetical protein
MSERSETTHGRFAVNSNFEKELLSKHDELSFNVCDGRKKQ